MMIHTIRQIGLVAEHIGVTLDRELDKMRETAWGLRVPLTDVRAYSVESDDLALTVLVMPKWRRACVDVGGRPKWVDVADASAFEAAREAAIRATT